MLTDNAVNEQRCASLINFIDGTKYQRDEAAPFGESSLRTSVVGITLRIDSTSWTWPWHQIKSVREEFYRGEPRNAAD